jgi:putative SOS response-associated peptidase YedK
MKAAGLNQQMGLGPQDLREIRIRWGTHSDFSLFVPRFNIAPAQNIAVVLNHDGTRDVKLMQWGLVPNWAKDEALGNQPINARAETLTGKVSFKGLVESRRCLIQRSRGEQDARSAEGFAYNV